METIRMTVLSNGLALPNNDATRRLAAKGIKRINGKGQVATTTKKRMQTDFLKGYSPPIRDLAHYREIVGDSRTDGPMVWLPHGASVMMERTSSSQKRDIPYYVIVDTAVGSRVAFFEELQRRGSVRIERD